jgi:hypothetical protein
LGTLSLTAEFVPGFKGDVLVGKQAFRKKRRFAVQKYDCSQTTLPKVLCSSLQFSATAANFPFSFFTPASTSLPQRFNTKFLKIRAFQGNIYLFYPYIAGKFFLHFTKKTFAFF